MIAVAIEDANGSWGQWFVGSKNGLGDANSELSKCAWVVAVLIMKKQFAKRWSTVGLGMDSRSRFWVCFLVACCGCQPQASTPVAPLRFGPNLVDADAPKEFSTTATGLQYRILRKSDRVKPTVAGIVVVHYRGRLSDGTVFVNSYEGGKPQQVALGKTIQGWQEGLQLIGSGGLIDLEIPPELAYGEAGFVDFSIPPNAVLRYRIELIDVK